MTQVNRTDGETGRLRVARAALVRRYPYLTAALYNLTFVEDPAVETMQIDDRLVLRFDPRFTQPLQDRQLVGLLFHEISHWLREHTGQRGVDHLRAVRQRLAEGEEAGWRGLEAAVEAMLKGNLPEGEAREKVLQDAARAVVIQEFAERLANIAEDIEINDDIDPRELPEGGFFPETFGFPEGLLAEEYSELLLNLLRDSQGRGQGKAGGLLQPGFSPDVTRGRTGNGEGEGEGQEGREGQLGVGVGVASALRLQVAQEIVEHIKARGNVPAGLARWAKEKVEPKVNWRNLLRHAVRHAVITLSQRKVPTYSLPHRRAEGLKPFILPGGYDYLPKAAFVVDTSGSVNDRMLAQAASEVWAAVRSGAQVTLYSVDAAVHVVRRVTSRQDVERLAGGGGTDMSPGIEQAVKDGHDLVVVLTDGYTPWPERPVRARVIACLLDETGPEPPAWIKTIRVRT